MLSGRALGVCTVDGSPPGSATYTKGFASQTNVFADLRCQSVLQKGALYYFGVLPL